MVLAIGKTKEEVKALLGNNLAQGQIAMLKCPACGKQSCVKLTSKAGNIYWKCRECNTAFGDDHGKPGKSFEKKENDESGELKPKLEKGPVCPGCKQKTAKYLTRTEKPYFHCRECNQNYWPDFNDKDKIGKTWERAK
jgi:transposase-like protein